VDSIEVQIELLKRVVSTFEEWYAQDQGDYLGDAQARAMAHQEVAVVRDIDALNEEMQAAGARFFAGGLQSAAHAKSLHKQTGGEVTITDGPYLEAKEHIGGFWILDAANMDEAMAWGRKAVVACRASVEVRQFLAMPTA